MLDFKNMCNEKLLKWLHVYEIIPMVRIIISVEVYKEAVIECFKRGLDNNVTDKYFYLTYINKNGILDDYNSWKLSNLNK